jgi:hypothetical protein
MIQQPNARLHLLPEAGARHERTLEAVRCKPWFGWLRRFHSRVTGRHCSECPDVIRSRIEHSAGEGAMDFPSLPGGLLHERDVIVLADTLQHEEGHRAVPTIRDEVWAAWADSIGVTRAELHLLGGFA